MFRYILKRIILMIPMLLAIILVVQLLLVSVTDNTRGRFSAYGYDDGLEDFLLRHEVPDRFPAQYLRYVYNLFVKRQVSATEADDLTFMKNIRQRTAQTVKLTLLGLAFTVLLGVPLGIASAVHRDGTADRVISMLTLLFASVPSFCLAIFLVLLFSLTLQLLPVFGISQPGAYVMPTFVLGIGGVALMVRMTRSAVADVLERQYVTTLYAKGLAGRKIIFGHVLKNSLITIIATVNNVVVQMFCSTLVVENFFSIPGLGSYLVESVLARNMMGVLACVVIIAAILMLTGLLCEVLQLAADPRARRLVKKTGSLKGRKTAGGGKDA